MRDEPTPEMITQIISDPDNPIGAEIARRAAESEEEGAVTYTSDEVEQMIRQHEWDKLD